MSLETEDDLKPLEGTALDTLGTDLNEGEDADMMAGYKDVNRGENAVELPAAGKTGDASDEMGDEPAAKAPATPVTTPAPTSAPVRIGRWTEDEVAERFAKLDGLEKGQATVAGHIGDLRNRLQGQKARAITVADLSGVVEEFGEQYAEALAKDLTKMGLGGSSGPSQADIDALVTSRAEQSTRQLEQKLEKKAVLRAHKDADDHFSTLGEDGKTWNPGPKAAEFQGWLATLPKDRQSQIATSWDSDVMISALSDFKTHQKAKTAPAGAAPAARQSRVARAVAPQGSGSSAPPVEDEFAAGYSAARGARG